MSGFRPSEIPTIGETSLPWFDPDWPWNLGRVARFAPSYSPVLSVRPDFPVMMRLFDRPIIEIDFSKVSAVAMRTGFSGLLWEDCEPQQVMIKSENQWLVLVRHISEIEVHKFFDGKAGESNEITWALRNELPCQSYVQLGTEGDRSERVIASTDDEECHLIVFNPRSEPYKKQWFSDGVRKMIAGSDRFSVHCFKGDYAVGNAVDILASWGFVQSKHWPTITSRFPELNEFNAYLIHQHQLYPDGSHPLHKARTKAPQQAENRADEDGLFDKDRRLIWGGIQFMLTTNQALAFRLLVDAYPGDVMHDTFEDKGIRVLRDSFRFTNAQGKKQNYPCWDLIVGGSVKDSKRLIDPSIVRSNPKKFSDPQHNPQDSPR
jgi:hypothetical protein